MLIPQYKKLILASLGGGIVDVELEDDIGTFLEISLLEVVPYISTSQLITLPYEPVIDLSDKAYNVVAVYRGNLDSAHGTTGLTDEALLFGMSGYSTSSNSSKLFNMSFVDQIAIKNMTRQLINTARGMSDLDFYFDNGMLYVNKASSYLSGDVTVEYNPRYDSVEEITDPYWSLYILRLATAHTKVGLGRARSKYRVNSVNLEMDGETLVQEGITELESIRSELRESSDIFYMLD